MDALFQKTSRYRKTAFIGIWRDLVKAFLSLRPLSFRDLRIMRTAVLARPAVAPYQMAGYDS